MCSFIHLERLTVKNLQAEKANPPSELVQVKTEAVNKVVLEVVQETVSEVVVVRVSAQLMETEALQLKEAEEETEPVHQIEAYAVQQIEEDIQSHAKVCIIIQYLFYPVFPGYHFIIVFTFQVEETRSPAATTKKL